MGLTGDIEVIGLGALNVDYIYTVERILDDGETVVNEALLSPGGSAANTICGLARLGVATGFIGVVGDDAGGGIMLESFRQAGVDVGHIRVIGGARTGSVIGLSDKLGRRSLYVVPGANDRLAGEDLDMAYLNRARLLHLSSFAGDGQFTLCRELMGRLAPSVEVSFAPGGMLAARGLAALSPILARTRLLFLNADELGRLTGQDIIPGADTCLKHGCRAVVVTLGRGAVLPPGEGAGVKAVGYVRDAAGSYAVEYREDTNGGSADTTGAGDAFAAGFLYGWREGRGFRDCGRLGDIVARFSIGRVGARQGLPTPDQLWQRYRELYPAS